MNLTLVNGPPPGAPPQPADEPAPDAELERLRAARKVAEQRLGDAQTARADAAQSPSALLEAEKVALADAERKAAIEEHEAKVDAIYRSACVTYGSDRVARIPTRRGSSVMRAQTEPESDDGHQRQAAFQRRKAEAKSPAEAEALDRSTEDAARLEIRATVLSPLDHFDKVTAEHFLLWSTLAQAKRDLVNGRILDEGKGAAP